MGAGVTFAEALLLRPCIAPSVHGKRRPRFGLSMQAIIAALAVASVIADPPATEKRSFRTDCSCGAVSILKCNTRHSLIN